MPGRVVPVDRFADLEARIEDLMSRIRKVAPTDAPLLLAELEKLREEHRALALEPALRAHPELLIG